MKDGIINFLESTGIAQLFKLPDWYLYIIMYAIIGVLFYLAIVKKFEPLLLMPIAFGMLLANLPGADLMHMDMFFDDFYVNLTDGAFATQIKAWFDAAGVTIVDAAKFAEADSTALVGMYSDGAYTFTEAAKNALEAVWSKPGELSPVMESLFNAFKFEDGQIHTKMSTIIKTVINDGGLVDILYLGVKLGIYPSLIFLGVGAMTDFSPLIANPKSLFMGAGAQLGVFVAFFGAIALGFTTLEAGAIGIIGGADGPTAILVTKELAPHLLGAIAIAAYSYMALIPIIQPPFMRLLTTESERKIRMTNLRPVSMTEKVLFPIVVTLLVVMLVPAAAPLVGFLMLGNLFNVSGVADRLSKTSQNELINIVTIFLGVSVGATANAQNFLKLDTLLIIGLGLCAFIVSTCGGLLTGKIMCKLSGGKINPLIGSAGVSAVPMAARVAQDEGRKSDPSNFLLMHAMGPNVAGVIGSAVAAGVFLSLLG